LKVIFPDGHLWLEEIITKQEEKEGVRENRGGTYCTGFEGVGVNTVRGQSFPYGHRESAE